jgi:hypothetical protein
MVVVVVADAVETVSSSKLPLTIWLQPMLQWTKLAETKRLKREAASAASSFH